MAKKKFTPDITIYTDGGCLINPGGPGACAYVVIKDGEIARTGFDAYRSTTNNRMELLAAIKALESTSEYENILLYSDSQYLVNTIEQGWAKNKNIDLWDTLDDLMYSRNVRFKWVRGHNGNQYNEICDQLCTQAMRKANLDVDEGYEGRSEYEKKVIPDILIQKKLELSEEIPKELKSDYTYSSWKELQKQTGIKDGCAILIHRFYQNGSEHKFKDYANLKVGGFDVYSHYSKSDLIDLAGQENWNSIWNFFKNDPQTLKAMKWHCRGLCVYDAIRVVQVQEDIALNKRKPKQ